MPYHRDDHTEGKYRYLTNTVGLYYTFDNTKKLLFQFKVLPTFEVSRRSNHSLIELREAGQLQNATGRSRQTANLKYPAVDLYLQKKYKKHEISLNLVGTYWNVGQNYNNTELFEISNQILFDDFQNIDNDKYSGIKELHYNVRNSWGNISVGNRFSYENNHSAIGNTTGSSSLRQIVLSDYFYAQYDHRINKLFYQITLGGKYWTLDNGSGTQTNLTLQPIIDVVYKFNNKFQMRAGFAQEQASPTLAQLSQTVTYLTENIFKVGNPELKTSRRNITILYLTYNRNSIYLSLAPFLYVQKRPIINQYVFYDDYIIQTYLNGRTSSTFGLQYVLQYKCLSNNLTFNLTGAFMRQKEGDADNFNYSLSGAINYNFRSFLFFLRSSYFNYSLSGEYLSTKRPQLNVGVRYVRNNLSAEAVISDAFIKPVSRTKTINNIPVTSYNRSIINDQFNMVALRIVYSFGSGYRKPDAKRSIDNRDIDSGI